MGAMALRASSMVIPDTFLPFMTMPLK